MKDNFSFKLYKAKNSKRTLFFFPAGFTSMWMYRYTVYSLNRMGITVVGFNFKWRKAINESNLDDLIKMVDEVNDVVTQIQNESTDQNTKYSVFGTSFGSVLALYTAKKHSNIDSVILTVPYGTVSHLLWTYRPSQTFKDMLVASGIDTEQKLHAAILPIETQTDLGLLVDRKIVNFTALNDKIVFDGKELANALSNTIPKAKLYTTPYGHFWSSITSILHKSRWDYIL